VNPDLARLALTPDSIDDGWLHAFEIRALRLDGALVVLSACETAAGRLAAGEGTLSLSRAFLQAGAVGTVSTLWPVGAPTATLMAEFYRQLAAGSAPAAALRFARLELRASGYEQPFYWAPFVLTTRSP
jgi:CHAT domain-containing protein